MPFRILALSMAAAAALALLSSCATDIAYFGDSYSPTGNIECFFTANDIKRPYKIMGKAIATPGAFASQPDFQNDIMNCAKTHGADALLVENFGKVKTGEYTNWNNNGQARDSKRDTWWNENGTASTQDVVELQATVLFIKYTQ